MDARDSASADKEAREQATRSQRSPEYGDAALRYLRNLAYLEGRSRKRKTEQPDDSNED